MATARRLELALPHVTALHLDGKGRGRALRAAWSRSDAAVVAYMDVDLSTDLDALLPLVAPLLSGHSDVAIGTRLARSSCVSRDEAQIISISTTASCTRCCASASPTPSAGSRRSARDSLAPLLTLIQDNAWFFDTELLVLAERAGLRIHEVPVRLGRRPRFVCGDRPDGACRLPGVRRLLVGRCTATTMPARAGLIPDPGRMNDDLHASMRPPGRVPGEDVASSVALRSRASHRTRLLAGLLALTAVLVPGPSRSSATRTTSTRRPSSRARRAGRRPSSVRSTRPARSPVDKPPASALLMEPSSNDFSPSELQHAGAPGPRKGS